MYRICVRSIILLALFWPFLHSSPEVLAQTPGPRPESPPPYPEWCVYMTVGWVEQLAADPAEIAIAVTRMHELGITKVYVEVYRGRVVPPEALTAVRDALEAEGFAVAGGIATVPGGEYGVRQDGPLGWFNWQNPKTQQDMREVTAMAAGIFDEFIVDDFLCTGDRSEESDRARGDRSWPEYRRDLMVEVAETVFVQPAKSVNPSITMDIKYPQWYDKFHEYGYDVPRESRLFDKVWVGTETRGASTQRFGFTQPYMGFINYRWIASIAGEKISGAWFDHLDCDGNDFIDQAYQTVLAGAPSVILFSYAAIREGHAGHPLLVQERERLGRLAEAVNRAPVTGVSAYKPPNSDGGSDLFIMDTIGMLGIPLVPVSAWPSEAEVVFLPAQAAAGADIVARIGDAIDSEKTIVMTPGFLSALEDSDETARWAGVESPIVAERIAAGSVTVQGEAVALSSPLDLAANLRVTTATTVLTANAEGNAIPLLTRHEIHGAQLFVLNVRTYSQADYDAVDEVLLPPHALGILALPRPAANAIRSAFNQPLGIDFDAGPRVTLQTLADGSAVIQNYQDSPQEIRLTIASDDPATIEDLFGNVPVTADAGHIRITLKPRSRVWLSAVR